jgi:F-type H+-transporting ATPase subunit a
MLSLHKLPGLFFAPSLATTAPAGENGGVASSAQALFHVGPLPVTNSMATSWVVAIALIVAIRLAIKKPRLVPPHSQAIVERAVEGIMDLVAPIVGPKVVKAAFPLLVSLFVYILIQNWSGLIPGVGTIMVVDHQTGGWMELIRPGNADMNGTIALASVAMLCWLYLIFRYAGPKAVLYDLFGNKADKRDVPAFIYYPLFVIFFLVGLLEVVSIAFRPVSLSFRLFGFTSWSFWSASCRRSCSPCWSACTSA